ncbi:MAG: hypothetical protein PSX36_05175 [bacterium]|nr:hypothetical protein [bacterium]
MKSFSLNELKKELQNLPASELADLCISLAKYKKDNKDLLGYLLVDSFDKPGFVLDIKREIDNFFLELKSQSNLYLTKKSLRKLLRTITKYCRYMGDKAASADLHIYFCKKVKEPGIAVHKSQQLINMYEQQVKKIKTFIGALHEDLQGDYLRELEEIT